MNLYKHASEELWLDRTRELEGRAAYAVRAQAFSPDNMQSSLYKGDVGTAVLLADLARPETACMPFFEEEGWV